MIAHLIKYFQSICCKKKIYNKKYIKVYWHPYSFSKKKYYVYLNEYQAGMWNCEVNL